MATVPHVFILTWWL